MRVQILPLVATTLLLSAACLADDPPTLSGSAWIGSPVSLNAVKGNATVLIFWNFDTPC